MMLLPQVLWEDEFPSGGSDVSFGGVHLGAKEPIMKLQQEWTDVFGCLYVGVW